MLVLLAGRSYFADGAVAQLADRWRERRLDRQATSLIESLPVAAPADTTHAPGAPAAELAARAPALPAPRRVAAGDGVQLHMAPFPSAGGLEADGAFERIEGAAVGLERPPAGRPYLSMEPGVMHMGGLAGGDVNGDGWPEVAVGTYGGVFLYANVGGGFALQEIDFPAMRDWIIGDVALVDLDGDAALDLFFTTWMQGSHILFNRAGAFSQDDHVELPRSNETAVHAAAFADVDRDGDVDVVTGATTHVPRFFYPSQAVNHLWRNDGERAFVAEALAGPEGETLALLFTDINDDGWPDLLVGNDYDEPDRLYVNEQGALHPVTAADNPLDASTYDTMSLDTGDLDNDGQDELYIGGIASVTAGALARATTDPLRACGSSGDDGERARCSAVARFQLGAVGGYRTMDLDHCIRLDDAGQQRDCVVTAHHWNRVLVRLANLGAQKDEILRECDKIPADFVTLHDICGAMAASPMDGETSHQTFSEEQPQVRHTNLLYSRKDREFVDVTDAWGAGAPGWTWNAKFADLDNDTWSDLFVAEGSRLRPNAGSAALYRNQSGMRFREVAGPAGLADFNPTGASLFLDYDLDGDLDLVTYPFLLTPIVWENQGAQRPGLQLELDDHTADNRSGIGARVTLTAPDGRKQVRDIKGSGGYQSHDAPVARFGLGDWRAVASISVEWPDGEVTTVDGLELSSGRFTLTRTTR